MRDFVTDVEDLVKKVVDVPGVDLAPMRSRVEESLAGARGTIENGAASVRRSTRVGASTADDYVRGCPWAAVGVAAGIGVLLGFTAHR